MDRRGFLASCTAVGAASFSGSSVSYAQPAARITPARLGEIRRKSGAAGIACGAGHKGEAPQIWVDGNRSKGGTPVQPTDKWHLGSISKAFTATLAGRLWDQGVLTFEDTVGGVLGPAFPTMNPAYRAVPIWQLFTHRSGMPHDLEAGVRRGSLPPREIIRLALEAPPEGPIGAATANYSNLGVAVAGHMMEVRTGKTWEALMHAEVFSPLQLASGGFGHPAGDQPQGQWPGGLLGSVTRSVSELGPAYMKAVAPAGNIHMNLPDLLTFLAAHRDHGALLKPRTWDYLHMDPLKAGVAMGWGEGPDGALSHSGSDGYFFARVVIQPRTGVVAAAVANRGDLEDSIKNALSGAVAAVTR